MTNGAWSKLTPDEQRKFVRANPEIFEPVTGAWGRRGTTKVYLPNATIPKMREALAAAWLEYGSEASDAAKGAAVD